MPRYLPLVLSILALTLLALACDGDGGPTAPTGGETSTVGPTGGTTSEPSPTASLEKTPPIEATPTTAATPFPVTATPAAEGTPAVAPADQNSFLAQYVGQDIAQEQCFFDPRTAVTACPGRGIYAIDPPLAGQDISCNLLIVQNRPVALGCTSQEPLQTLYYEIRG